MHGKKSLYFLIAIGFLIIGSLGSCGKKNPTTPIIPEVQSTTHPVIWVNEFEFTFSASETGQNPSTQVLKVKNTGVGTLNYSISDEADWLSYNPTGGTSTGNTNEHTISINKSGLAANDYSATISVTCGDACNSPQTIQVSLKITKEPPPEIWTSSKSLTFSAQTGGSNPPDQTLIIKNSGSGTLNYQITSNANWLSVTPDSGSSAGAEKSHKIGAAISGLNEGTYNAKLTIADTNATNSPQEIEVTLTLSKTPPPQIWVSNQSLSFQAYEGGSNPSAQTLSIMNSGGGTLNYTITWDETWLSVNPFSGSSSGARKNHNVSVNIGGLNPGTYSDTLIISDPNAVNSPQQVNVTLKIDPISTDNEIYITCSPTSGKTGTIVTITTYIKGNTQEIKSFGFKIHYDPLMFSFQSAGRGTLTSNWTVDGQETSSGVAKIGGYSGGASPLSTGNQGSIAVIKLRVTGGSYNDGQKSQVNIDSFTDDIVGMTPAPGSRTFTYKK